MDEARSEESTATLPRRPMSRMPLIIGGLSCGLIVWMFVIIMLLIAWKLSG